MTKLLARVGDSKEAGTAAIVTDASSKIATPANKPLIEEIGASGGNDGLEEAAGVNETQRKLLQDLNDAENFDWQIEQPLPEDDSLLTARYGFNQQYNGYLRQTRDIGNDINDLDSPETSTAESRREERINRENEKFDPDYYLSDLYANDEIPELLRYEPSLVKLAKDHIRSISSESVTEIQFTDEEKKKMLDLPRRTFIADSLEATKLLYVNLIPIIFAYCYDARTTMDDHTSESAWTVGKLAMNISCLDSSTTTTIPGLKISCVRRALAYPLYRNYELSLKCWNDMYYIFRGGKRALLKALLDVNHLFAYHDVYYVYSKTITEDYCAWIQTASDSVIRSLAHEINHCDIQKGDLGWDIPEIERTTFGSN